jgi:uncharacterized protein YegL
MTVDFAGNPNQRIPCVLVLDGSSAMATTGDSGTTRIEALNSALAKLESDLNTDGELLSTVLVAVVEVGGQSPKIIQDWSEAAGFSVKPLLADGAAMLGKGINIALWKMREITVQLQNAGISYSYPIILILSSGNVDDSTFDWLSTIEACRKAEAEDKIRIYCVAVEGADETKLRTVSSEDTFKLPLFNETEGIAKLIYSWSIFYRTQGSFRPRTFEGSAGELPSTDPWRNVGL